MHKGPRNFKKKFAYQFLSSDKRIYNPAITQTVKIWTIIVNDEKKCWSGGYKWYSLGWLSGQWIKHWFAKVQMLYECSLSLSSPCLAYSQPFDRPPFLLGQSESREKWRISWTNAPTLYLVGVWSATASKWQIMLRTWHNIFRVI